MIKIYCDKLILILVISILLSNCSGCSKSGLRHSNRKSNTAQNEISEINGFISGKVVRIIDGDTYDLLVDENKTIRVRMEGIDAPEKGMPYFNQSKDYLGQLCFNKIVKLIITGKDNYKRIIGFTYLDDVELGHEMIRAGLAWHFKKYNSDIDLSRIEIEAQNNKRGIWSLNNPMPPWENRNCIVKE